MGYEPFRVKDYLDIGLAWHSALENWYSPEFSSPTAISVAADFEQRLGAALIALEEARTAQVQAILKAGVDDFELDQQFEQDTVLLRAMLRNYAKWSVLNDEFVPVFVEKEFEVPIKYYGLDTFFCQTCRTINTWADCEHEKGPVVYQGRVDGLVKDFDDNYYILEHKTASQLGGTYWLAIDEQTGSYIWALREMLHIDIKGVIHTTTLKRVPEAPKVLKSGLLSMDKRQSTDLMHYGEAITKQHPNWTAEAIEAQYGEMLRFLESDAAPVFIRRVVMDRPQEMIDNIGQRIYLEAWEIFSEPAIYPTVSPMNCNPCPFFAPCLARQEDSDWQFLLKSSFRKINV
jgi:hypothetical protein